jgi:chromosomal replication initiation ATPase DnaA
MTKIYLTHQELEEEKAIGEIIKKTVCEFYNIPIEIIENCTRKLKIVKARHQGMKLTYKLTHLGTNLSANLYNKHHATLLHALKVVDNDCTHNRIVNEEIIYASEYKAEFDLLTEQVESNINKHKEYSKINYGDYVI